jgi:WD40 repeat protein
MSTAVRSLLAYSSDGRVLAIAQERELLVYSGTEGSPLWRSECDANIVAVGVHSQFVFALDQNGGVNRWDALTGESRQTVTIDGPVLGMAVAANGDCAVVSSNGISIIRNSSVIQSLVLTSITAVQWSADGKLLACGGSNGRLSVYQCGNQQEALASQPVARIYVNDPILSIACHQDGSWLACAGNAVWQLDPQRAFSNALMNNTQKSTRLVAISQDGNLVAFTVGDQDVVALHLNPTGMAGTISYPDRSITGVAFGPDRRLGIALDTGDGNIIDFNKPDGTVVRTDPHHGRSLNRWLLNVSILPRPQEAGQEAAGASPGSKGAAIPAWAGPLVGPAVGFLIGMQLSRDLKADAAATLTITATLIGFVGGGLMWLIDLFKGK